jgi:hypothetical protein
MTETPESARQRHRPDRVTLLLVGESPPSGGTFFYFRNSKLYRETAKAFRASVPDLLGEDFLASFVELGCYLDDLCLRPVNQLKRAGNAGKDKLRAERKAGETPLAERMSETDPLAVVLIGLGIEANVRRATTDAGCADLPFWGLPFPNWPRDVTRFQAGVASALLQLRHDGVLRVPRAPQSRRRSRTPIE